MSFPQPASQNCTAAQSEFFSSNTLALKAKEILYHMLPCISSTFPVYVLLLLFLILGVDIGFCLTQGPFFLLTSQQVQFGHAGACANQASETAVAKNQALKEAGVFVPRSFDELGDVIQ